jgi:hypothetical protein
VIFQSADRFTVSTYLPGAETAFSGVLAEFRVVGGGEEPALLLVIVGIAVASGVPQRAFEVAPQASVHPGGMTAVGWASRSLAGEPPRRLAELMRTNGGLDADYRVPVWRDVPWGGRANI